MKTIKNKIYLGYILIGLLYFIIKIIWYSYDFICFMGVIHGLIATALTIFIGILSLKTDKLVINWFAVLIPLIILPLTPIIMIFNLGQGIFQIEKLTILVIFECLATAQVVLAILMFTGLKKDN